MIFGSRNLSPNRIKNTSKITSKITSKRKIKIYQIIQDNDEADWGFHGYDIETIMDLEGRLGIEEDEDDVN